MIEKFFLSVVKKTIYEEEVAKMAYNPLIHYSYHASSVFEKICLNNIYIFTPCLFFLSMSYCIEYFVITLLIITFITLKKFYYLLLLIVIKQMNYYQ
jgi:hypothetical protein